MLLGGEIIFKMQPTDSYNRLCFVVDFFLVAPQGIVAWAVVNVWF